MLDLSDFAVSGSNDTTKQVSVTAWNSLLDTIETGVNTGGSSSGPWFNIEAYLDPDRIPFVTDDLPATQAAIDAIAAITAGPFQGVSRLQFPGGRFHWSSTPNTPDCITLEGAGSAQTGGGGTLVRISTDTPALNLEGAGSICEGFQFWGANVSVNGSGVVTSYSNGTAPNAVGCLASNDFVEYRDVQAVLFGGGSFLANADGAAQANSVWFIRCQGLYAGGHAIEFSGTDGNAGGTFACSAIECAGMGILDFSFLGNTHYSPHTRGCGLIDPTGCGNPVGSCQYASAGWYVKAGQEVAAKTTEPGTNAAVWGVFDTAPWASMRLWVSGQDDWIVGGSYGTNIGNANSINCSFYTPYAEQSQPPAQVSYPAQIIGGLIADGNAGSTPHLQAASNCFVAEAWKTTPTAAGRYSFIGAPDGLVGADTAFGWHDGTNAWKMTSDGVLYRAGGAIWQTTATGLNLASGMGIYHDGTKVVGARGASVADATDAASAITQLNALLARCRAHGLIAT